MDTVFLVCAVVGSIGFVCFIVPFTIMGYRFMTGWEPRR